MKNLLIVPALAAVGLVLTGCAAPGPYYAAQPVDPYQWRTVSVTPVASGTIAREGSNVTYTTEELPPQQTVTYAQQPAVTYVPQPVYVTAPVYAPAPAYYYPPVSIGLDFVFSNRSWGGGRGWGGPRGFRGRR